MKVDIKRIDKSLPLPVYKTKGSVGFDIFIRTDTKIKPNKMALLPGNVIIKTPPGYMLMIASRSSAPKMGLTPPHGIGVIDNDYCGEDDEIKVLVYNFSDNDVFVRRGDRVAQGVFVKIDRANFYETENFKKKSRGGFGSTG